MGMFLEGGAVAAAAYLIGSVSFAWLISRANGVDLRKHGSGNLGATNVVRVIGKQWGWLCFCLDFLKGLVPVLTARALASGEGMEAFFPVLAAGGVVAGHIWPLYLRFKGGKGVATTLGALTGVAPLAVIAAVVCWNIIFFMTKIVSLASLAAAAALPVSALIFRFFTPWTVSVPALLLLLALGLLIIIKHRTNIGRLLRGEEHRFAKKGQV